MKKLLIVGAGGLGREVYQWVLDSHKEDRRWDSVGFLDDNLKALDQYALSNKMVGTVRDYEPKPDEEIICAIGDTLVKAEVYQELLEKGAVFTTVIHPSVILSESCTMGKSVIIGPGSIISINVAIADGVVINSLSIIGHDVTIEQGCIISDYCDLMGNTYLEEGVFVGSGAKILAGVRVFKNAKVGVGSIVIKNVGADTSVFGNPAKVIYSPKNSK